jgi:hypothetical protein
MGLSMDLRALGAALEPEEAQWGDAEVPQISLCPRLKTVYSPRTTWTEWKGFGEDRRPSMPEWARVWDYGPTAEALGLSLARNSKRPPRYGLKGLPATGRKQVWRALALLEDERRVLSFWTVSLPTDALIALARLDAWPLFQDRVRKELGRKLQAAGLPVRLVGVAELQPKRSRAAGFPCPHLHLVFQGRKSPSAHWALSPADLDEVIRAALATAGVHAPDGTKAEEWLATAGNVQQVKRSVRAYLSKYMTKGSGDTARWIGHEAEALLPRQWWFWSRPLRAWVIEHVFPLAFPFMKWVHAHREGLEEMGLARFRVLPLDDPRAPLTFEVSWLTCGHLGQLVYLWQTDEWDREWFRKHRVFMHQGVVTDVVR